MKTVKLQSIILRNFRGEKERTTNLNPNGETTISGENGLGKSRHFDAFMWLLFGKDTKDRKDYNVRTIVGKEPLHRVECSVSATLEIDGQPLTIKRAFVEKWVKPRGQTEEIFKGNETETCWNDVPVSVTDYQKRINEIINDSVFKMVTNPLFFASMKWQDQREQLFQLAGTITDAEIGAKKPEFAALLDKITGKSFTDFKREISAKKKRLKDDLEQIQPRIDQTQKLMPESADFDTLEAEIKDYENQIANIDKAIGDKSEAIRQQYDAVQTKQREINDLKQKQQKVLFDAQTQANEDNFKVNEKRREIENGIKVLESDIYTLENEICGNGENINSAEIAIKNLKPEVDSLRQKWHEENAKEYQGDDVCPTCARALPEDMKADARKLFTESKTKKLAEITAKGQEISTRIDRNNAEITRLKGINENQLPILEEKKQALELLKKQIAETPVADAKAVVAEDLAEYRTLGDVINGLESVISEMEQDKPIDTEDLRAKKTAINGEINTRKDTLRNRDLIVKYTQEIADLEAKGKDLAQQIADVEREEYTIAQFTKAKIDECERRINGLFHHVTFKLFDYTIDGNEYECCVPLVAGVPFDVANTAGQVNAGLDIINALVKFHGVSAPIFIDGRESVNNIIDTESQIINLVVSKDKELIIK
jgi:DNA repair exonuclease SbcCD ATPase subunit